MTGVLPSLKSMAAALLLAGGFTVATHAATPKAGGIAPGLTVQPIGRIASADGHVALSINATGQPPLSVQWFRNQQLVTNDARVTGADQFVLNLDPVLTNDTGNYFAIVTNSSGAATSAVAAVTVNPIGVNFTVVPGIGLRLRINSRVGDVCRVETSNTGNAPWATNGYATNFTGSASYFFIFASGGGFLRVVFDHMLPVLAPPSPTDPAHAITAYGKLNQIWRIQGTTNFVNWDNLITVTNTNGWVKFNDVSLPAPPRRFYRITPP